MSTEPIRVISLEDKYLQEHGRVILTGTQALVRLALMQKRSDERQGLNTAGYVTGYRGSPLGTVDQTFLRAVSATAPANIRLHAAVNEDLAATAIWGTQQTGLFGPSTVDGVFSMWYGKGPGVHRSGDVFLHANLAGTHSRGGVLAIAGDDHLCKSSTNTHQSEYSFVDAMMPTLNPAGIQDVLDLGLQGWAMSRHSGCWIGMKLTSEVLDSSGTIVGGSRSFETPLEVDLPQGGLGIRWPDKAVDQEQRLHRYKLPAAQAFARANRIDQTVFDSKARRIGIISTGKSYLDTLQAFEILGLTEQRLKELGISLYKVSLVWPLEPQGIRDFCERLETVIVIEEKRSLIESQLKDILYNIRSDRRPRVLGKTGTDGSPLFPAYGELTPAGISDQLSRYVPGLGCSSGELAERASGNKPAATRAPYFCSGCPHNRSTKVPAGSKAFAGIGCHYMTLWMDRDTRGFTHMGGEGANWIGLSQYSRDQHVFQNIGDGTYFHSGYLAIRAAIAANVNITYKILFNDAVAMTGGQPVDGDVTPLSIALQVRAEGVERIAIVAENASKYTNRSAFPAGVSFHGRQDLDLVQQELRQVKGVSVLIFDQMCAAEKRRDRKRGKLPHPTDRLVINKLVCEGCGDCSKASNCLSVVPIETEYGTKREIDQSTCNMDFTCVDGFCPSFVTLSGTAPTRRLERKLEENTDTQVLPTPNSSSETANILVTGIGGTGVITIGAIIAMAAHIDGRSATTLDMTGMAQKGGPVTSHIKIAPTANQLNAVRIAPESATLILGCDLVVTAGTEATSLIQRGHTRVILNSAETVTSEFVLNRDYQLPTHTLTKAIESKASSNCVEHVDASTLATRLMGDSIGANLFMVGIAFQKGLIPVSEASLRSAIDLNGVAVEMNQRAFRLGRLYEVDHNNEIFKLINPGRTVDNTDAPLQKIVHARSKFLTEFQDEQYAQRYVNFVDHVQKAETALLQHPGALTATVAQTAFKLMAYKDEYEVARLLTAKAFRQELARDFEGRPKLSYNMAPPLLAPTDPSTGLPRKIRIGGWVTPLLRLLAKMKHLRGTPFDVFGYMLERREERQRRDDYERTIRRWADALTNANYDDVLELAKIPDEIRGFGHIKARAAAACAEKQRELAERLTTTETACEKQKA